jgi:glycine oxidase ThiO
MTVTADVLVLGGGIAGLTTALAAAARGQSVIILDTPRPGSASRAAAGMLAPSVEEMPAHLLPMALAARDLYPRYLATLTEQTGIDVALNRTGILQLIPSGDVASIRTRTTGAAEWLDERALAEREPAFAGHPGALLHPFDGAVDNLALMDALGRATQQSSTIDCVPVEILSIDVERRSALTRTRGRYSASSIVVATGAWAGGLAGLPRPLPVRPVRGELLRVQGTGVRHVTYGAGGYLVPRGDTILVGATSEEAGFENETSLAGLAALRGIASRAVPALAGAMVVDHWSGLRPMSLDTHPILGADPDFPALVYACGYSRNGILFAPWAAEHLAGVLAGEPAPDLAPFSVARAELRGG